MSKKNKNRVQTTTVPFPGDNGSTKPVTPGNAIEAVKVFDGVKAQTNDGFENFATRTGMMQDSQFAAGHYQFNMVTKNRIQLEAAYRGSWVVGTVIDAKAEDMTRAGVHISSNEKPEEIADMHAALSRLSIFQALCFAIKWGNLYGGALAVIQIEGQELESELNIDRVGKDSFKGISVFDRHQIRPDISHMIKSGPHMGLPEFYDVLTMDVVSDPEHTTREAELSNRLRIHHSRVIRFTGIDLPYNQAIAENSWGESVLERMWDRLIAFDNVTMSSAALVDRASLRAVGVEGLRDILAAGGKAQASLEAMFDMMRRLQNNSGLTVHDNKDILSTTAYSFAGLGDMMLQFGQQLAGASGIPLVRFFGQSPAGLSATGEADLRMYYDNINAQQESKLRNPFEVILKILYQSMHGHEAPKDLSFVFTPLWQMSAMDKANIAKINAETIIGVHQSQLIKSSTALRELREDSGDTGLFSNISDEEIAEADEQDELPPMPDTQNAPDDQDIGAHDPTDTDKPKLKLVGDSDFKESDHPRKDDGKFGKGTGGAKAKSKKPSAGGSKSELSGQRLEKAAEAVFKKQKEPNYVHDPEFRKIAKEFKNAKADHNKSIKGLKAEQSELIGKLAELTKTGSSNSVIKSDKLIDHGDVGTLLRQNKETFEKLGEAHPELKTAVYDWSRAGYIYARAIQQGKIPKDAEEKKIGEDVLKGLDAHFDKLPSYNGPIARDLAFDDSDDALKLFKPGATYTTTSYDSHTAKSGYHSNRQCRLIVENNTKGKAAWGLSQAKDEAEVIVPKGVKYTVDRVEQSDDRPNVIVYLREV